MSCVTRATRAAVPCLALALLLLPARLVGQAADPLAPFAWMAGCWELRTPTRVLREEWMPPLGGLMLGMSRTVVGGTAREFEFLRIELRATVPTYVAQPGGAPPTPFALVSVSDTAVVFGNPAHDFPQRVIYRPRGPDSLVARIEGSAGGATRGMDFPMTRVGCAP